MTIHNKTHLYMEQVSVDKVSRGVGGGEQFGVAFPNNEGLDGVS